MKVTLNDLNNAMRMIKQLASDVQSPTGIMMNIKKNSVALVYSDNKKAIYKDIPAEVSDEEVALGDVIFEYQTFMHGMDKIQKSGGLNVDEIELDFSKLDKNISSMITDKYYKTTVGESTKKVNALKINHAIKTFKKDGSLDKKFHNLTRFDYNEMLFNYSEADIWDKEYLISLLKKLSKGEEGKAAYLLKSNKAGFVVNRNSVFFINCTKGLDNFSFTLNSKMAKYLVEILNKSEDDSVKLFVKDNRYCSIVNDDNSFGIWFEMAAYKQADGNVLNKYKNNPDGSEREYNDLKIIIDKISVSNAIKNLKIGANKAEKSNVVVDFNDEEAHNIVSDMDEVTEDKKNLPEIKNEDIEATVEDDTPFSDDTEVEEESGFENLEEESSEDSESSESGSAQEIVNSSNESMPVALIFGDIKKNNVIKLFTNAKVKDKSEDSSTRTFVMNYQVWEQILSVCDGDYVILGIYTVDEKTNYFKFEDIVINEKGEQEVNGIMYTVASNS